MDDNSRRLVKDRAGNRCEYCLAPQLLFSESFHIEHIVAVSHGGGDELGNLCLACPRCNLHKGPNLAGIDPETGEIVRLYNPREDSWSAHMSLSLDGLIVGDSGVGRATIAVLQMNQPLRVELRKKLVQADWNYGDFQDE